MLYGNGFNSGGKYKCRINNQLTQCYRDYFSMLRRCYKEQHQIKFKFIEYEVSNEWLDYQNYAEWWYNNYKKGYKVNIKIDGEIKIYSPETSYFIKQENPL